VKTDELIAMLATSATPVAPDAVPRRFATALGWGIFATALLMAMTLGVRPDIVEATLLPMFWVKLLFPVFVAIAALYASIRLARPGMPLGRVPIAVVAPLAAIWALGLASFLGTSVDERQDIFFGDSWAFCLIGISLLSIPVFIAAMWTLKGLAPTRLSLAGGAAGLLAGASGAAVYALYCPELEPPFLAIWYVLGMLIPAAVGAIVGPRLLRW
jgi:hypothetical protein